MSIPRISADVGQALWSAAKGVARYMPEPIAQTIGFADSLSGAKNGNTVEISGEYKDLLERQLETQMELQQVTFSSNIERSQHEARMAAVRNIRVS
jgi:flagellar basal body rod protein FlgB